MKQLLEEQKKLLDSEEQEQLDLITIPSFVNHTHTNNTTINKKNKNWWNKKTYLLPFMELFKELHSANNDNDNDNGNGNDYGNVTTKSNTNNTNDDTTTINGKQSTFGLKTY